MFKMNIQDELKFDKYFQKWNEEDKKNRGKIGLQLINWIVNGSSKESRVPPILTGLLRGSGSVFVGSKFIGATPKVNGKGNPNQSHSEKENIVTVGFNTGYARKMHELKRKMHELNWRPGPKSQQSGDVGNKYIEKHLNSDKEALMAFYGKLQNKNVQ